MELSTAVLPWCDSRAKGRAVFADMWYDFIKRPSTESQRESSDIGRFRTVWAILMTSHVIAAAIARVNMSTIDGQPQHRPTPPVSYWSSSHTASCHHSLFDRGIGTRSNWMVNSDVCANEMKLHNQKYGHLLLHQSITTSTIQLAWTNSESVILQGENRSAVAVGRTGIFCDETKEEPKLGSFTVCAPGTSGNLKFCYVFLLCLFSFLSLYDRHKLCFHVDLFYTPPAILFEFYSR